MRVSNSPTTGYNYGTVTTAAININQVFYVSAQAVVGGASAAGTMKLQVSNDYVDNPQVVAPSNWSDVTGASVSVSGAGVYLIPKTEVCYNWARFVFTSSVAGQQTITCVADSSGSLNNKYFYINAGNNGTAYYVWFNVSGGGTDPSLAGLTGVEVDISTGDTASAVATAVAAALDALSTFAATSLSAVATVTNSQSGPFVAAVDSSGATATGFSFAVTAPTGSMTITPKTSGI